MSTRQPDRAAGPALPSDYDSDPGRFAANQAATRRFLNRRDVHPDVALRFAAEGCRRIADIGGGTGVLARLLAARGIRTVVIDPAGHVTEAPQPAVRADATALPLGDRCVDGAAALFMLYHLSRPLGALREAHRVLRPGGLLAVAVPSRHNDPELAAALPRWGRPLSFDAENGPDQLRQVFGSVDVYRWDAPLGRLPDADAVTLYLRGRGLTEQQAKAAARTVITPLTLTKRGLLAWARRTAS